MELISFTGCSDACVVQCYVMVMQAWDPCCPLQLERLDSNMLWITEIPWLLWDE